MLNRKVFAVLGVAIVAGVTWIYAQGAKQLTTQDLVEIQQLYSKYNWAIDTGDGEGWAATFTPDGVFNNTNIGHDALVKFVKDFHGRMGTHVKHWNTNLLITPSAEGAQGQVYLVLVDFGTKPPSIATSATYSDELVKTGQGWRFKKRNTKGDAPPAPSQQQ